MRARYIRRRLAYFRWSDDDWWTCPDHMRWPRRGKEGVLAKYGVCSCGLCRGEKFRDRRQATCRAMDRYRDR